MQKTSFGAICSTEDTKEEFQLLRNSVLCEGGGDYSHLG